MATAPLPASTTEGVAFLQQRVAAFGFLASILGGVFWVFRLVLALTTGDAARRATPEYSELTAPSFVLHGLGIFFSALLWLLCRGKPRSRRFVERAEVVCLLASVVCYEAMGATIEVEAHPELIILLALTLLLVGRAIYVPGTARRSLVLGAVAGVPLMACMFCAYLQAPPPPGESAMTNATVAAAVTGTWWAMTVTLATAAARVVYGLRREASAARQLGQYTLGEKIGEGGMGAVYRASHAMLRRPTAVKLLLPERASEVQLARFEREVQLSARLTHPNTITIFDYGRTPDGVFYYAMELLGGATLEEIVECDGPQPPERVARVLEQVSGALAEAHGIGLIHRDIKPANVMLCDQGGMPDVAKVLDFGLVKQLDQEDGSEAAFATGEHAITGTPLYMSPEAIVRPEQADGRSDLYSLGAVAYYLLTGRHVFTGTSVIEIFGHHLHTPPVAPETRLGAPIPTALAELVLACLAKDPAARPASAPELLARVESLNLAAGWTVERARSWWNEHAETLRQRRTKPPAGAPPRTVIVDLADRFERLDKYLSERAG